MNTKAFIFSLVGVLVLGGSVGGAFAGGVAVGEKQVDESANISMPQLLVSQGRLQGQPGQEQIDQIRRQIQSGEIDPEAFGGFRQDRFGEGFGERGSVGRLSGTIEEIVYNTITLNTPRGLLTSTIRDNTAIQMFIKGTLPDLQIGMEVTVVGQRATDGTVEATSIVVTPDGSGGFFRGGGFLSGDDHGEDEQ